MTLTSIPDRAAAVRAFGDGGIKDEVGRLDVYVPLRRDDHEGVDLPDRCPLRIRSHEPHQLSAAGTFDSKSVNLRILAGQHRRQEGKRVRLEIVSEELTLLAEGFPVSAEQNIDQHADPRSEDKREHLG